MKKLLVRLLAGLIPCILLLCTNSCRKVEDMKLLLENGNADIRQCPIREMKDALDGPAPGQTLTFAYNSKGDPLSITSTPADPTYSQWLFYYDKKGRLAQSVTTYTGGTFQRWHIYFYDNTDRITGDSVYSVGLIGQRSSALYSWFNQIFYDHLNRVIKEIETVSSLGSVNVYTLEYGYNAAGNLSSYVIDYNGLNSVQSPIAGYVNKPNILLTNKVWRFLARDYSLNGHNYAASYNENGLPTLYSGTDGLDVGTFFYQASSGYGLSIQYSCDLPAHSM